jgi:ABC-type multidrug transport system fused ATPase/permease subunit
LNFEIKKGEKILITGESGSGKTTLMNILLRFYDQQKGEVLIDG